MAEYASGDQECEPTTNNQGTTGAHFQLVRRNIAVTPQQGILWALTIGGSVLFVIVSKVTILMKPLVNKSWYTELVLYLICLAMGTMLAAISFQLIPEGIGRL